MSAWSYRVTLDAVDITAQVPHGTTSVEFTENASGLMNCRYNPASGVQDPDGPAFESLTLEVSIGGAAYVLLFSGVVIRATWDPKTRSYALRASTRMQEYFRAIGTHEAVLAALPGSTYSEAVFGDAPDDLWDYAELCMSTTETAWWIDTAGALDSAPWAAGTADASLTAADVDSEGSFAYQRADAESLTNQVILELDYQVQRKKVRSHTITWVGPDTDVCAWWAGEGTYGQWRMPWTTDVEVMGSASSWNIPEGVRTDGPVPDGAGTVIDGDDQEENSSYTVSWSDDCGFSGDAFLTFRSVGGSWPVWSASATGYIAFAGQITERYKITVEAAAHIADTGETVTVNRSGSLSVDPTDWPPDAPDASTYLGWDVDSVPDNYEDDEDETERANMLDCGYAWAAARIRGGQRSNDLICRARLRTDVDLSSSISVSAYGVVAGPLKARSILYTMDPPRTTLTLAVSRGKGGVGDVWTTPPRPDSSDPVSYWEALESAPYPDVSATTSLQTHVGLLTGADAAPDPDLRTGLVTNAQKGTNYDPNAEEYEFHFAVEWPAVEVQASSGVDLDVASSWAIDVLEDPLSITA